jgi:hypothetical protein
MTNLTEQIIGGYSTNASADSNARSLAGKNAFPRLCISEDKSLIFGECEGSAKDNYRCSADFSEDQPVFRCTCPSRQIPCKHVLGLMYCYVQKKKFSVENIPANILEKREARQKKKEKKPETEEKKPPQVNKEALKKKIALQLEGLEILRKLLDDIVCGGLGTISPESSSLIEEQIKNLGNYSLYGAQSLLREFTVLFSNERDPEKHYSTAIQYLNALYALYKKGREYLENKLNDPELKMSTDSDIEDLLGHIWQFDELERQGLVINQAELVQLSFNSYSSAAELSWVDEGIWCHLEKGRIFRSLNYRPYRAAQHIKEDDSFFEVLKAEKLAVYPGDINNRVRWESFSSRTVERADLTRIKTFANSNFTEVIKQAKNIIKNPLGNKNPLFLLNYAAIGMMNDDFVATDTQEQAVVLKDDYFSAIQVSRFLRYLDPDCLHNQTLLVRFFYDADRNFLQAQPVSVVTGEKIIRLVF